MLARLRGLTTERAATIIVFVLLFAMASRVTVDPDMWWHIRLGQQIFETGDIIYFDTFSHTRSGNVHKNHSWLAQVTMALLWQGSGHLGMTVYVATLATAGMFLIYLTGRGSVYTQGFVLVAGGACAAAFWSPRPQMFTFLFAAALLLLLRRLKRAGGAPLWRLLPLMCLWANSHGGYIVAYIFIVAFLAGECLNHLGTSGETAVAFPALRRLFGYTLLTVALLPLNPLGLDIFVAPVETLAISGMREYIQEWKSPDFAQPVTWSFILLATALIAAVWNGRRKIDFADLLLSGGTMFMALISARHFSLFAIAAVPVITIQLDAALERKGWALWRRRIETPPRIALNLLLIVLVALGATAHVAYVSSRDTVAEALALNYPVKAVEFLNESTLRGKLFNSYNWGGYLILMAPDYPVFIDGRTDLHRDMLADYTAAAFGSPAWTEVFERWDIGIVLIESGGPLAQRLDENEDWRQEYHDELSSIYALARDDSGGNGL